MAHHPCTMSGYHLIAEGKQALFPERVPRLTRPDGSFEFGGLPAGRYRGFAVAREDVFRFGDGVVARKPAPSKQVEVRAGQTTTMDLTPVPRLGEFE